MPTYSYECKKCRARFDLLEGVSADDEKKTCKACGSSDIKKIFSAFSVNIKDRSNQPNPSCGGCPKRGCPHSS